MAQIQMTEALAGALIQRLQAEYGTQAVSNFALDILLDAANAEVARLQGEIKAKDAAHAALSERVKVVEGQIEDMKQAADPKRAEVMGAADSVKQRKANGSNSYTK
jgi:hypothetical protein